MKLPLAFINCFLSVVCLAQSTAVDTSSREISYQEKKTYDVDGIFLSNEFNGARLNGVSKSNDTLTIRIEAENQPINTSPWYAFKIWTASSRDVVLHFDYIDGLHRYYPKLSKDGIHWNPMDSSSFQLDMNSRRIAFRGQTGDSVITRSKSFAKITIGSEITWVSGQEIIDSENNSTWVNSIDCKKTRIGESPLGAPIWKMDIGNIDSRKVLLVFSRQHPPEVTGNLAMRSFIEEITGSSELAKKFRREYHTINFPMINPDGVDQGHWRHNTGGVDLNRDWSNLHQPENQLISNHIKNYLESTGKKVYFGIDFHSTWKDIFYVLNRQSDVTHHLSAEWLEGMENRLPGFVVNDREIPLEGAGTSVRFFYHECGSDGVTYEVGDDTDREYLKEKARVAAVSLMTVLLDVKN